MSVGVPGVIELARAWYVQVRQSLESSGYLLDYTEGQSEVHEIGLRVAIIDVDLSWRVSRSWIWEAGSIELEYTPVDSTASDLRLDIVRESMVISSTRDVTAALARQVGIVANR